MVPPGNWETQKISGQGGREGGRREGRRGRVVIAAEALGLIWDLLGR